MYHLKQEAVLCDVTSLRSSTFISVVRLQVVLENKGVFLCQQYQPQMFLDNLSSSIQSVAAATSSTALLPSASSHYEPMGHETQAIARGSISDIISLD